MKQSQQNLLQSHNKTVIKVVRECSNFIEGQGLRMKNRVFKIQYLLQFRSFISYFRPRSLYPLMAYGGHDNLDFTGYLEVVYR